MERVLLDGRQHPAGREGAGQPDAGIPRQRADFEHAARPHGAQQHVQQLAFIGRDVNGREMLLGVAGAHTRQNRIFDREQLLDVALEPLVLH